jgi:TonB family protein
MALCALLVSALGAAPAPSSAPSPATAGDRATAAASLSVPPVVRSRVQATLGNAGLDAPAGQRVMVQVQVDTLGMVTDARVDQGGTPFDSAAVDAARWWIFTPAHRDGRALAAQVVIPIEASAPDADPMVPDVVALAYDAEAAGDVRGALDAWTGVGLRAGSPLVADAWSPRAHAIGLAARLPKPPTIPLSAQGKARGAHNSLQRTMARGDNEDYARRLSEALQEAPWYADAYRWRAAARAMAGQRDDAMRDLRCYALAARDSAAQDIAARALRALAVRDTIGAYTLLK